MGTLSNNRSVTSFRGAWSAAGLAAGVAGLATSYFAAMALTIRESPVVAVAELVIRLTPGPIAEYLISLVGSLDKPLLLLGIFLVLAVVFAWAGRLARRTWWAPAVVYAALTGVGFVAVGTQRGAAAIDALPVAVGFVTWMVALSLLTEPLAVRGGGRRDPVHEPGAEATEDDLAPVGAETRRTFGIRVGILVAVAGRPGRRRARGGARAPPRRGDPRAAAPAPGHPARESRTAPAWTSAASAAG